jgi:hypothetical protein
MTQKWSLEVRELNKKWRNIIIVSMVILVIEVAGSLFFLFPYYRLQRVFESIDKGQWSKTQEYYNSLSESQQDRADSYMDAYGAYISERYIKGEISYLEAAASFDAINSISDDSEIFDKYTPDIDRNEYIKLVNQLYDANLTKNTEQKYENIASISDIQKRMSADTREGILIELLNKNLDKYIAGELSYEDLYTFVQLVTGMSINDAYNYAYTVEGYAINIQDYRDRYVDVENMLAGNDYLGVMSLINELHLYDFDTEYYELYQTAYQTAYDSGITYYAELLQSYINSGDTDSAVVLMASLESIYGDDMNLEFAKDELMADWQKACIARVEDWETYLQAQLGESSTGQYILENEYDNLKPDSMVLYDINADGYPELCMFNSGRLEDDYVGTFIFGYDGSEYKYMGYVNIISFGISSNIVAFPICFDRAAGEEVCLYNYDGQTLSAGRSAQKFGDSYYVNGEESVDIDYLSAQTSILLNQDVNRIQNSGYVSLEDYKEYIVSYENQYEVKEADSSEADDSETEASESGDSEVDTQDDAASEDE